MLRKLRLLTTPLILSAMLISVSGCVNTQAPINRDHCLVDSISKLTLDDTTAISKTLTDWLYRHDNKYLCLCKNDAKACAAS